VPTVSESLLYKLFTEVVYSDLQTSTRVSATGVADLLLQVVHSYCFAAGDVQLTDASLCEIAPALCRKDCSVYCKTQYVYS
jgi:hypothetical protein